MVEHEKSGPLDLLTWSFSRIAMWAPATIVAIIFYEVVLRYLFSAPTLWVNEMSLWIAGGIYLSAGLYSMQQRSHIRIFIIYDIAPLWLRRVFDSASVICVCIFAFAVIWGGFGEAKAKFMRFETFGTAFDPPIPATIKPLVLTMLLFLALQAISNLVRDWPPATMVRKTMDIVVTILVVSLALFAMSNLFGSVEEGMKVPMRWRVGIFVAMIIASALMVYGLFKDFNHTPEIVEISSNPADEVALYVEDMPSQEPPDNLKS
jgi:TRAP-type C4-dicarboxylate transport system permease small subunit